MQVTVVSAGVKPLVLTASLWGNKMRRWTWKCVRNHECYTVSRARTSSLSGTGQCECLASGNQAPVGLQQEHPQVSRRFFPLPGPIAPQGGHRRAWNDELTLTSGWAARQVLSPLARGHCPRRAPSRGKATAVSVLQAQRPWESPFEFWQMHTHMTQTLPRFRTPECHLPPRPLSRLSSGAQGCPVGPSGQNF